MGWVMFEMEKEMDINKDDLRLSFVSNSTSLLIWDDAANYL